MAAIGKILSGPKEDGQLAADRAEARRLAEEEKARGRTRVDGFIDVERYNDYYNPDAKIGHLRKATAKEDSHSSNVERLFILNVQ